VSAIFAKANIGGDTWAYVDQGASITAGALSVSATAPSENATADSKYGKIGIRGSSGANTKSEVGGSVKAFVGSPNRYTFDATSAINASNNSINLGPTSLRTGDPVVYDNDGGPSIAGLQSGKTYYAIVNPSSPSQVKLAGTPEDAQNGIALPLTP